MQRSIFSSPMRAALGVLIAAVVVQACDSSSDPSGVSIDPAFALNIGSATLPLTVGATASTFIKATRTGDLTGAIAYTVTGAPAGLTAAVVATTVPDSSTLTLTATAPLAAATYPIVVNATAPGADPQQATISVTVSVPAGGEAPAIKSIAVGEHTCALTAAGAAYCWGYNGKGQLGNNAVSLVNLTPVAVAGGLTFQSIAVSRVVGFSCGLTTDGVAYCWGDNAGGALGDGTTTSRLTPTRVAGGLTFKSLVIGANAACGLVANGTAYCWGSTFSGAFGDGFTGTRLTPAVAAPGMTFESLVAGGEYTCGLTAAGAAYCWGLGLTGQLGDGQAKNSPTPVAVSGGLTFRSIVAGGLMGCGLTTDSKAYCWGYNFYGSVGDGASALEGGVSRRAAPVPVIGGLTFQSLSAGYETMCGVTDAGAGYCWGYNLGAIGDGTEDHRSRPTAVAGGLVFRSISSGTGLSCGITTADAAYCWGNDPNGGVGDGTGAPHFAPVAVRWP